MNPEAYRQMAQTEDDHWWFVGRRAIISKVIESLSLPSQARILEIGAGTGGNLEMLSRFGDVSASELDEFSREHAIHKTGIRVRKARLPDLLPFQTKHFDLICLFDVLEHVEDDVGALRAITQFLKPEGRVLLTVPAHQWLWSVHDAELHHFRRYSAQQLQRIISQSGYMATKLSYFNAILFPLVAASRLGDRILSRRSATGTGMPPRLLNAFLSAMLSMEAHLITHARIPFGVSLLALLEIE
jgi:SAM-dependent methyltransferase